MEDSFTLTKIYFNYGIYVILIKDNKKTKYIFDTIFQF